MWILAYTQNRYLYLSDTYPTTCCFYNIASITSLSQKGRGKKKTTLMTFSDFHSPNSHFTSFFPSKTVHYFHFSFGIFKMQTLTIPCQVHATKHQRPNELCFDVSFKVDKYCRQILIRVVGYAGGRDSFDEFHISELSRKPIQMLIY